MSSDENPKSFFSKTKKFQEKYVMKKDTEQSSSNQKNGSQKNPETTSEIKERKVKEITLGVKSTDNKTIQVRFDR